MKDQRISWDKLESKYLTENIDYKDQARQILIDEIGFEPDFRVSIDAELSIRRALYKFNNQQIDKTQLDGLIEVMSKTVTSLSKRASIR